jgi:hypothetical protein
MLFESQRPGLPEYEKRDKESVGKRNGLWSAFGRQKVVESGLVHPFCSHRLQRTFTFNANFGRQKMVESGLSLSPSDGRLWVFSSVKLCSRVEEPVSVVVFEKGSTTEVIGASAFDGSRLKSIVIPSSVVVLGKMSFYRCWSLEWVTFESGSRLERIKHTAFQGSGLKSIVIPSSVVVLGGQSFFQCRSLESLMFESGSRLKRIGEHAFRESRLKSIVIPPSVVCVCPSAFVIDSLSSVSISGNSGHFRIRESFLENINK